MDVFEVAAKILVNGLSGAELDLRNYCDVNSYDATRVIALLKPFADVTSTSAGSPASRMGKASIASTSGARSGGKTVTLTINDAGRQLAAGKKVEDVGAALRAAP